MLTHDRVQQQQPRPQFGPAGGPGRIVGVAIQTNLSCRTEWLGEADPDTVPLWCTYHPPGKRPTSASSAKPRELAAAGIRFSVGVVGLPGHLEHARGLRADLPEHVYLWVNAAEDHTYTEAEAEAADWTPSTRCPLQPRPAPLPGPGLPDGGVGPLGRRCRHRAPLSFRERTLGQPLRRLLPRRPAAAAAAVPARPL
ncbi:hypothetical protein ABZV91_24435 [Nocardia sp. NPDC004568]|uniref:hypothetical protein n=1 Tax=Nocardia sp. NPDC004568 TaxID=3154551 RepID=UPI0033B05DF5